MPETCTAPLAKVGRNRPCPCGSGRKFKVCCLPRHEAAPDPTRELAPPIGIATIAIDKKHVALGNLIPMPEYGLVNVDEVLRAIATAEAAGVSAIVLQVDSLGGQPEAALALYDALMSFRERGGRVVTFIPSDGYAASSAPLYVLAADGVVAHPRSFIGLHGVCPPKGNPDAPWFPGWFQIITRMCTAILCSHSLMPPKEILAATGEPGSTRGETPTRWITPHDARRSGLVDLIGDRARAQDTALRLVRGERIDSKRQRGLAARGELTEWAEELQRARELGAEVRRLGADAAHLRLAVARGSFNPKDWFIIDATTQQEKPMMLAEAVAISSRLAPPSRSAPLLEPHALADVPVAAICPGPWVPSANNIVGWQSQTHTINKTITVSDIATGGSLHFKDLAGNDTQEPDTSFSVLTQCVSATGSPPLGAYTMKYVNKDVYGVYFYLQTQPGYGNSVTFDVVLAGIRTAKSVTYFA